LSGIKRGCSAYSTRRLSTVIGNKSQRIHRAGPGSDGSARCSENLPRLRLVRLGLAGGFLVKSSASNRADDDLDNVAEGCQHRKLMRKKASSPHEVEVGKKRTYNPDGQASVDRSLHSGAKARPDRSINPDQCNATDESEQVE